MRFILFLYAMLLSLTGVIAQPSNAVIRYTEFDYLRDSDVIYIRKVPVNSKIGLKISNINKRLLIINNDIQSISYNEQTPKLFEVFANAKPPAGDETAAAMAGGDDILIEAAQLNVNGLTIPIRQKLSSLNESYKRLGQDLQALNTAIINYSSAIKHIKAILQYHSDMMLIQDLCNRSFIDLRNDLNALTQTTFTNTERNLEPADRGQLLLRSDYVQNKTIINRYIATVLASAEESYNIIAAYLLPGRQQQIVAHIDSIKASAKDVAATITRINSPAMAGLLQTLKTSQVGFPLESRFKDLVHTLNKTEFSKLQNAVEAFTTSGKKELFATYDYFNESNYTYYVSPQSIDKDLSVITANVTPKDNIPCSPLVRTYEVKIRPKGGLKMDFSTGLFLNFGGNDFKDQTYRYDTVEGEPGKAVIRKNKSKNAIFPSLGALMHIYPRTGNDFQAAGCFGLSTKDLEKVNYHLGASLIFGYAQRFILNGGLSLTKAELLDDKYEEGQVIEKPGPTESVPTSSFNRLGFFFSFTYNLSK